MSKVPEFNWERYSPSEVIKVMVSDMRVIPPVCRAWSERAIKKLNAEATQGDSAEITSILKNFISEMKSIEKVMVVVIRYVQAYENGQIATDIVKSDHVPDIPTYPDGNFKLNIVIEALQNSPINSILFSMIHSINRHLDTANEGLETLLSNSQLPDTLIAQVDGGIRLIDVLHLLKDELINLATFTKAGLQYYSDNNL